MFPAAPRRLAILALVSILGLAPGRVGARAGEDPPPDEALRATLEPARVPPAVRRHGERLQAWNALLAFYRQRSYQPAWWDAARTRPAAARLLAALDDVESDGLDARLYPRDELRSLLAALGSAPASGPPGALTAAETVDRAHLDVGLSYVFLALAAHLSIGRLQAPETVRVGWHARPRRAMKVIVGKAQRSTPVFSDLLTQVVLNPSWNVPDSITAREMIPRLLREPGYLRRQGIQIERKDRPGGAIDAAALTAAEIGQLGRRGSPFKLRQPPGPGNALGRFKFVVPNQFDVYLHDTPTGQLFARSDREFSHGCIRLEKPAELAGYLLRDDPRWTPDAVAAQLRSGRTVTIDPIRPLPAHILYLTAWVAADGALELRRDIYRQDARLDAALRAETPLWEDLAALFPSPTITAPRALSGAGELRRNSS